MTVLAAAGHRRPVLVLVATLLGVAVTARLGWWQLGRAAQKEALQQTLEQRTALPELPASALADTPALADTQHYRRVRLQGRWMDRATVFLDNRQMDGRPGFFVVTPLKLSGSQRAVVVERGWAPRDQADRTRLPALATPAGEVTLVGQVVPPPSKLLDLGADSSGPIRQNLDLKAYEREVGVPLAPLAVLQDGADADDGLLRRWPRPAVDVHKHYGYAFQWFALCALMAGLYVWFQLVRPRLARRA